MDEHAISFGPYRLLASQRLQLEGERPVRLGSRAFDILAVLVERAGEVVGKEQLIAGAWPQTYVEESNLKIQVRPCAAPSATAKTGTATSSPFRGYNFVAQVRREEPSPASPLPTVASTAPHNLPFAETRMIGREETVAALVSRLPRRRLVTIVGAGGIGKTTVALAVAERVTTNYRHGVCGLWTWHHSATPTRYRARWRRARSGNPHRLATLVAAVRDNRMLLFDNCEHVIEATASLAAALLGGAPGVNILATSREPLGVAGEREYASDRAAVRSRRPD